MGVHMLTAPISPSLTCVPGATVTPVCAMKLVAALPFALVLAAACSSEAPSTPAPAATPDGGTADAAPVDPKAALAEAVRAATWTRVAGAPKSSGKQDDVFFASKTRGFVASGPESAIFRTDDGGGTWKKVADKPGTFFRSVLFTSDTHGFAGNLGAGLTPSIDDKNPIYETKDGGDTWAPVASMTGPAMPGVCNLTAAGDKTLVAVGRTNGPAFMAQSRDDGATWATQDLSQSFSMLIDAHFTSANEGLLAGQNAGGTGVCTIMRTTDGGKTLTPVFSSKTRNSLCWKLHFPSPEVGYVAVQDTSAGPPTFGKTTDGGKTWTELPLPDGGNPKAGYSAIGIGFLTDEIGWVVGSDSKKPAYRTFDGGLTWEEEPNLAGPINRIRFVDKNTVFASGSTVWKLEIPGK